MWNNMIQTSANWAGNGLSNNKQLTISSIYTNYISVGQLSVSSFTDIPSTFNASNWSYYPAISTVVGEKDFIGNPLHNIRDFDTITARTIRAEGSGFPAVGGSVIASLDIQAPLGDITNIITEKIDCGSGSGEINLYGADLVAGDNALYVEGGTTLSGGGVIHGVSIGALTVAGVNTQRIDVLPIGIDIISPTFITIDSAATANVAAGATCSVAAGGTLSLAGGAYIEYNSDEHLFVNTSAGNDFTDIYVGNVHGARPGSKPLRINENRGVEISNVTQINLSDNVYTQWNPNTYYDVNSIVENSNLRYVALLSNRAVEPISTLTKWLSNVEYYPAQFVSTTFTYQCISTISSPANLFEPNISSLSSVWKQMSSISSVAQIWTGLSNFGDSYIAGNKFSFARFGALSTNLVSTNILTANQVLTDNMYVSTISSYSISANNIRLHSDANSNASIGFFDVNGAPLSVIGDSGSGTVFLSLSNLDIVSNKVLQIISDSNASLLASNQLVVGASNATFLGTYDTTVLGLRDTNIQAYSNVNVVGKKIEMFANDRIDISCNNIIDISCATLYIEAPTEVLPGLQTKILVTSTLRGYFGSNLMLETQHVQATNSLSAVGLSSLTLSTNSINVSSITGNTINIRGFVSSGEMRVSTLRATNIFDVVNLSTINTGGITTSNIQAQRIVSRGGTLLQIGSFEPTTGAGIGYFTPGNGGGRYSVFHAFSTFTNVIIPTTANGFRASTVFIQANLSTFHTETSTITSRNAFTSNITASNVITPLVTGNTNLELRGNLQSRLGDVIFGSNTETTRNFVSHYNTIFSNTTTFNNTATFNCNANFNSNITSLFGDITFGSVANSNKNFVNYYNTIFSNTTSFNNTVTFNSNLFISNISLEGNSNTSIKSGNGYFNNIYGLDNGFVKFREYIDMSDNAILNGSLFYASTMIVAPTNGEVNGLLSNYIGAGVVFQGKSGDSNFWMLSKPDFDLSGTVAPNLPGSEGIYIIKRSGVDGNQLDKGRLYDNNIYTPWANVTGDLEMKSNYSVNNASNISVVYSNIYQGIVQPVILCGTDNTGSAGVTVTLPVTYPTSNYFVQLTYHANPAGNKPLYHDSLTTSNFFVDGDANADFDWTTFYVP